MTDKSFGDHTNRNIVKNPLLSTAVTGLCLEDLTYNAVLLPVSRAQEASTRPDPSGPQNSALSNPDNATNYPAGDANANPHTSNHPSNTMSSSLDLTQKTETQNPKPAESKASAKSSDDFDVNEYFARLQGTRYVSAPPNLLKEDKNANLEATEENLEEINLNDDRVDAEVPQSFTSDIAQNFSQLPTVLPQVASAVFSSFSNMLSMKSREHTPDVAPSQANPGYQEVQFESQRVQERHDKADVPMLGMSTVDEIKEFAPPPKEPSVIGTTSYRLATKKKYAQIPGLSCGEKAQIPSFNPVTTQTNMPPYFMPSSTDIQAKKPDCHRSLHETKNEQANQNLQANINMGLQQEISISEPQTNFDQSRTLIQTSSYNIFNPDNPKESQKEITYTDNKLNFAVESPQTYPLQETGQGVTSSSLIPPPPMFSNTRTDSQSNQAVGKTILPPSVARRIAANHPVIKSQTQAPVFDHNIFVPTPITDGSKVIGKTETTNFQQPAAIFLPGQYSSLQSSSLTSMTPPDVSKSLKETSNTTPLKNFNSDLSTVAPPSTTFQDSTVKSDTSALPSLPPKSLGVNKPKIESIVPPAMFSMPDASSISSSICPPVVQSTPGNQDSMAPPPMMFAPSSFSTTIEPFTGHGISTPQSSTAPENTQKNKINLPPPNFINTSHQTLAENTKTSIDEVKEKCDNLPPPPPLFFNPNNNQTFEAAKMSEQSTQNVPLAASQIFQPSTAVEPPKVIAEPPKAVGNLSYRMTKKKPKYYAGPIVGVGSISNNVKPTIPVVESSTSQSSFLTPAPVQTLENAPGPIIDQYTLPYAPTAPINQPAEPFDISRPSENVATITSIGHAQSIDPIQKEYNYNTVFDVSRSSSDMYEPPKQENKGFGIIGSLKSKLSSLDINKIQSSVTTFFDPAYNVVKKESSDKYSSTTNMPSFEHYAHSQDNQGSNFEIFVPNVEQQSNYGQGFEYQSMYPNQENQQNYQTQYLYSHYPNQGQNYPPFSYYSSEQYVNPSNVAGINQLSTMNSQQRVPENIRQTEATKSISVSLVAPSIYYTQDNFKTSLGVLKDKDSSQEVDKAQASESKSNLPIETQHCGTVRVEPGNAERTLASDSIFQPLLAKNFKTPSQAYEDLHSQTGADTEISQQSSSDFRNVTEQPQQTDMSFGNSPHNALSTINFFDVQPTHKPQESQHSEENSTNPSSFTQCIDNSNTNINFTSSEIKSTDATPKPLETFEDFSKPIRDYGWKEEYRHSPDKQENIHSYVGFGDEPHNVKNIDKQENIHSYSGFGNEPHVIKNIDKQENIHSYIGFGNAPHNVKNTDDSEDNDIAVSSTPLYGLSTMLANKSKELTDLEQNMENMALADASRNIDTIFNRGPNVSFFDINPGNTKSLDESNISSDLNICQKFKEVDLPDKAIDLTTQLIENITSPIQLLNPVEDASRNIDTMFNRGPNVSFFDINPGNTKSLDESQNSSDFNICEKFKEVDLPDKAIDLTTQLIENITSPIQLLNPVGDASRNIDTMFNRGPNVSFFDINRGNTKSLDESQNSSDFNICEKFKEVDLPDKAIDLTTQLIENITSPIQLLNPVEVPLTESDTLLIEPENFNRKQFEEISHITEETIETIQVQSATELLEDEMLSQLNADVRGYGWCSDKSVASKVTDHDYATQDPVKSIGFLVSGSLFSDNSVPSIPKNASDETKAEYKCHEESPVILTREMSIPSAPPIEDEDKSETIDVHSIEQDASRDFPGEEFIIEPSETDDDKIEYKERKSSHPGETAEEDSFTYRIEKFKQLDQIVNQVIEKTSPIFGLSATSPSLPIASYFDTGNYAAETHYKNLNSPPNYSHYSVGSPPESMRIPPGFEEEFQRRLSGLSNAGLNKNDPEPQIPDTSTQTRPTYSPTFSTAQHKPELPLIFNTASIVMDSIQDKSTECVENASYPVFDLFGANKPESNMPPLALYASSNMSVSDKASSILEPKAGFKDEIQQPTVANIYGAVKEETNIPRRLDAFAAFTQQKKRAEDEFQPTVIPDIFNQHKNVIEGDLLDKPPTAKQQPSVKQVIKEETVSIQNPPRLPDPLNFFSTIEEPVQKDAEESSFNRLASYFAAPPKPEPSKPFFELSQGQDHYRHDSNPNLDTTSAINRHKTDATMYRKTEDLASKINFSQIQNKLDENKQKQNPYNIPESPYVANLSLIKDLTSPQNLQINPEQIVRTVNYFTVEYDNENPNFMNETNIGEPEHHLKEPGFKSNKEYLTDYNTYTDDTTLKTIINKCKFCCDFNTGYVQTFFNLNHEQVDFSKFKVKTCMDSERPDSTNDTAKKNMDPIQEKSHSVTVTFDETSLRDDSRDSVALGGENRSNTEYSPVKHHWFYRVDVEDKSIWRGFSAYDSQLLEQAYHSPELTEETRVATDGGRFDVNIVGRLRIPVYWQDKPTNVRRCSWFYKGTTDARYVPYTEAVSEKLEEEYRHGMTTGEWHRRLVLPSNELVVMHGPAVMVHFLQQDARDGFSAPPIFTFGKRVYRNPLKIRVSNDQKEKVDHLVFMVHGAGEYRHQKQKCQSTARPRVVRRGHDESEIEDFEPSNIDHLLLLCHGVGSACDMRFRSVEEVVDDFRATSLQLLQSHYRTSYDNGVVGRVEVLPISWHATLHSGETGVDRRLARITLDSIPRLRSFTNDTVLDVLFYTSPVFCQTIIDTVCSELNRIYKLFCSRNPNFNGGISLGGHSLGSVILYDLLCHQNNTMESPSNPSTKQFVAGLAGTGLHTVKYPKLDFHPVALYALGSPIAIFECIRGVESLGVDFKLPTCTNFFNIFHPYDPIAYRIEPLVNQQLKGVKPYLIPHHKGRKRMHLELRDTIGRVGADIKQKLVESIKNTWANVWRTQPHRQLEKVVEEELEREQLNQNEPKDDQSQIEDETNVTPEMLGRLNAGRRIDYVLQEAPFEMINEYLFAMSSHVCYWESEDTMLLMLREIYDSLGVQPDSTVPQPNLTVQRTRTVMDETVVANMSEHPSTSTGGHT